MYLFWAFLILLIFLLVFVVAVRNKLMAWGWNFALIAIILYAGLFKMTGMPRDTWLFSTIEGVHGDVEVVYNMVVPKKFIYLLVKYSPAEPPIYLRLVYTKDLEQDLNKAQMVAQQRHTAVMADADALSRWAADLGSKTDSQGQDGQQGKMTGKNGKGAPVAKGETPKEGGDPTFYPKPIAPDPLKDYHTTIEGTGPMPSLAPTVPEN